MFHKFSSKHIFHIFISKSLTNTRGFMGMFEGAGVSSQSSHRSICGTKPIWTTGIRLGTGLRGDCGGNLIAPQCTELTCVYTSQHKRHKTKHKSAPVQTSVVLKVFFTKASFNIFDHMVLQELPEQL